MPRVNQLSPSERAICSRLRWARMETGLSRADFCKAIAVKFSSYVNYEWGNAKVPMKVGWNTCHLFGVNQEWLATGKEPSRPAYQLHTLLLPEEAYDLPFSEGFNRYLRAPIERRLAEERRAMGEAADGPKADGAEISALGGSEMAFPYLIDMLKASAERLPLNLHWNLFKAVVMAIRQLDEQYREEIAKHRAAMEQGKGLGSASHWKIDVQFSPPGQNEDLTNISSPLNTPLVDITLDQLLADVGSRTAERGSKTALARELSITPQQLNDWLTERSLPSGVHVLHLLRLGYGRKRKSQIKNAKNVQPSSAQARTESSYESKHKPEPKTGSQKSSLKSTPRKRR